MLRLKGITKNYKVAGGEIEVLKGLDVSFRKSEFVSILGPSGCGKTTTLNIVGGLDKYTKGDLIIAGKSTKDFKDRDWDVYRNQRIGFIFQSYNLIPHQTVLGNVELALTISGISKEERVKRSMRALERVGLKGEERKRPNQLSGGQCQRVAIARALVNEPDILLADEPTGALDSKTSVQIMELIKEISQDKLVIMVTHNSDIAEQYSTRIIRLVDGEIIEDTNPYSEQDEIKENQTHPQTSKAKKNKAKMSWWTAFKLSARNLLSKAKRTMLTSIAGSIGIIGISAVLAVSSGVTGFIDNMQDDMLSGNPITVTEQAFDLDAMMSGMDMQDKVELVKKEGYVNVEEMLAYLSKRLDTMDTMVGENNITKEYVDYVSAMPKEYATVLVDRGLDVANNVYTDFARDSSTESVENISLSSLKNIYTSVMKGTDFGENSSFISMLGDIFMQAPSDNEYVLSQYDVKAGKIATAKNEIMIVVNNDKALTDIMLAQLGYYTQEQFINIAYHATDSEDYNDKLPIPKDFSYEQLMGRKFVWYSNDTIYYENTSTSPMELANRPYKYYYKNDQTTDFSTLPKYEDRVEFEIVGILSPKDNLNYGCLQAGFYYTQAFSDYALEKGLETQIVKYLKDAESEGFSSVIVNDMPTTPAVTYEYKYYDIISKTEKTATGYVGKANAMSTIMSSMGSVMGNVSSSSPNYEILELTLRHLGGETVSNDVKIYAKNLEVKKDVLAYLDAWNDQHADNEIKYTDTLSLIMAMITTMVDIVTIALISFTSLSLVVSCVMIAIITYVSVVERVKEIGVIRSLGGRKKDVSNLFNAETLVIGTVSGLIGIGFTYFMSLIVNIIVQAEIGFAIMTLQPLAALIMVLLSISLTVLSGLIPAKKASRQDPVVALRTE